VLQEIIAWHLRGTRYHIRVDPADERLAAGEPGVQLTWMDARVGDRVITPRTGKAVVVNALWYNGLPALARSYLLPLVQHLADHGVGSIGEIFDGDPPFAPNGCFAQAWSVAELLRAWQATEEEQ
jgi:glycogen debranching enzyme